MFFFGKKNQKPFVPGNVVFRAAPDPERKSLLLLFFRKKDLACFLNPPRLMAF
jgi:hypothetical protein